jgi:hypothetical protein
VGAGVAVGDGVGLSRGVGAGVEAGVGPGVGVGAGGLVGRTVGSGSDGRTSVGSGMIGVAVGAGVGGDVGLGVGDGVGAGDGAGVAFTSVILRSTFAVSEKMSVPRIRYLNASEPLPSDGSGTYLKEPSAFRVRVPFVVPSTSSTISSRARVSLARTPGAATTSDPGRSTSYLSS